MTTSQEQLRKNTRARFSLEAGLYVLIALLAAGLRFHHLGSYPLGEAEAREALAAFRHLQGESGPVPLSPAYASLTLLVFAVAGSSEAAARLIPALAGTGLVLVPALLRREFDRLPALIISALLAVSPTFVATSRTAGGTALAALALTLAWAAWLSFGRSGDRRWAALAAAAFGLGLASGPSFYTGLAIALVGWGLVRLSGLDPNFSRAEPEAVRQNLRGILLFGLGSLLAVSTLMLVYRPGLGAVGAAFVAWLAAFGPSPETLPLGALPLSLLTYELMLLTFGLIGLVLGWFNRVERLQALGYWAIAGYLFLTVYPGRAVADLQWVLLPSLPLAVTVLVRAFQMPAGIENRAALVANVGVTLVLFAFMWLNLASYAEAARTTVEGNASGTKLAFAVATLALVGLITTLFAAGWAKDVAFVGLSWSATAALLVYTVSSTWGLTQLRPADATEIWNRRPITAGMTQLVQAVNGVSNRYVGSAWEIPLVIEADPDSAMGWAFRKFTQARFVSNLGGTIDDPVVIAPAEVQSPALGSSYVGEAFGIRQSLPDERLQPGNWVNWFLFRRADVENAEVILWVRQDVQLLQTQP